MTKGRNDAYHPNRQVNRGRFSGTFPMYVPDHWNPELGESFWEGKGVPPEGTQIAMFSEGTESSS